MATQYSEIDQETGLTVNPKNAQSENVVNRRLFIIAVFITLLVIVVFAWILVITTSMMVGGMESQP